MTTATCQDAAPAVAEGRASARLYLWVLLIFLAVYGLTAQHGPAWQDSGIFQLRILHSDLTGQKGLALAHPLLIALGKLFSLLPVGDPAWRMNMVSAVCMAAATANLAILVRRIAPRPAAACWIAAGFFGLAHTPWWLAGLCESQAILAALFTAELNVLVSALRRPCLPLLLLLGLLNGLALTAHDLALLALPAYGLTAIVLAARRRVSWAAVPTFILAWLVGASAFLTMAASHAVSHGWLAAVRSALFGGSWQADVLGGSGRAVAMGCGYILYNFPNLALPAAAVGLAVMRRRLPPGGAWAFAYLAAVYLLFAIRYTVVDQFMFFLPFYAMVCVLAGLGLAHGTQAGRRWLLVLAGASLAVGPVLYAVAPALSRAMRLPVPGRKDLPYRDPYAYWLTPWKVHDDSARRFARQALAEASPRGTILADGTSLPPLQWVQRVEGLSPRVRLMEIGEAAAGELPAGTADDVFAVSKDPAYCPAWLTRPAPQGGGPTASLQKDNPGDILYRVHWRTAPGAPWTFPATAAQ